MNSRHRFGEGRAAKRDFDITKVRDSLSEKGIGCQFRPVDGVTHLMCSCIDDDGDYVAPCFWLSISSRGEWFIFTMQDECFVIHGNSNVVEVVTEALATMNECHEFSIAFLAKHQLRHAKRVNIMNKLDVDYSDS